MCGWRKKEIGEVRVLGTTDTPIQQVQYLGFSKVKVKGSYATEDCSLLQKRGLSCLEFVAVKALDYVPRMWSGSKLDRLPGV